MNQTANTTGQTKTRRGGHLRLEKDQVGDSPYLGLKVPRSVHNALLKRAEAEGVTISALTRKALEQFVSA